MPEVSPRNSPASAWPHYLCSPRSKATEPAPCHKPVPPSFCPPATDCKKYCRDLYAIIDSKTSRKVCPLSLLVATKWHQQGSLLPNWKFPDLVNRGSPLQKINLYWLPRFLFSVVFVCWLVVVLVCLFSLFVGVLLGGGGHFGLFVGGGGGCLGFVCFLQHMNCCRAVRGCCRQGSSAQSYPAEEPTALAIPVAVSTGTAGAALPPSGQQNHPTAKCALAVAEAKKDAAKCRHSAGDRCFLGSARGEVLLTRAGWGGNGFGAGVLVWEKRRGVMCCQELLPLLQVGALEQNWNLQTLDVQWWVQNYSWQRELPAITLWGETHWMLPRVCVSQYGFVRDSFSAGKLHEDTL